MARARNRGRPRCPRCGAAVTWSGNPSRPFCSAVCKLLDLGGWLDERYRVPGASISREGPDGERGTDEPRDPD